MSLFSKYKLLKKRPDASNVYFEIVRQARQVEFYTKFGVPDTVNGRFDLIALHAFIVMKRLKSIGKIGENLSQALFDRMFADIDTNLREMGVSDISVGRKVKGLAAAYYGRVKAYENALLKTDEFLEDALKRNVYVDSEPSPNQLSAMANYFREQIKESENWTFEDISTSEFCFLSLPPIE